MKGQFIGRNRDKLSGAKRKKEKIYKSLNFSADHGLPRSLYWKLEKGKANFLSKL